MKLTLPSKGSRLLTTSGVVIVFFVIRLLASITSPILDRTESRATLVSKLILEHEIFSLQTIIDNVQVPYWSKPPLHYWLVALSMKIFGVGAFQARISSILCGVFSLLCVAYVTRRIWGDKSALFASLILASSSLFFLISGMCLVDATLLLCMTVAFCAGLLAVSIINNTNCKLEWSVCGIALGCAFCTKGPVAPAIFMLAGALWLTITKSWRDFIRVPWHYVIISSLLIAVPIFYLLEHYNPGFLKYFFVNENFYRYLRRDYEDRSGSGHAQLFGMSWVFLIISFLPWTPILAAILIKIKFLRERIENYKLALLCLSYGLAPAIFFTFGKNHLATYQLPALPGLAIFVGVVISKVDLQWLTNSLQRNLQFINLVTFVLSVGAVVVSAFFGVALQVLIIMLFLSVLGFFIYKNVPEKLFATPLMFITAVALVICSATEYVEDYYSTSSIFRSIAAHPETANKTVVFPWSIPYSAHFYTRSKLAIWRQGQPLPVDTKEAVVAVRTKDIERYNNLYLSSKVLFVEGKWKILVVGES